MTDSKPDSKSKFASIHLEMPEKNFWMFSEIFQKGVFLKTQCIGNAIEAFLKNELQLTDYYITNRLGTIFLDNKPIDDLKSGILRHYSKVALSSAMPGLVGAIMRQGSPLADMREGISYKSSESFTIFEEGFITVKLFNLVIYDIGKEILKKGIIISHVETMDLLTIKAIFKECPRILLNFKEISRDLLITELMNNLADFFNLSINFIEGH